MKLSFRRLRKVRFYHAEENVCRLVDRIFDLVSEEMALEASEAVRRTFGRSCRRVDTGVCSFGLEGIDHLQRNERP